MTWLDRAQSSTVICRWSAISPNSDTPCRRKDSLTDMDQMGRIINFGIYVVCLIGLAASADVAVSALTASPAPLTGLAGSLAEYVLVALPIVGGAFVLRYKQLTHGATPRQREIM